MSAPLNAAAPFAVNINVNLIVVSEEGIFAIEELGPRSPEAPWG